MESAGYWRYVDSDHVVFTELMKKFGVKGAQVEEMWCIEGGDGFIALTGPVHGIVFLFKHLQNEEPSKDVVTDKDRLKTIYFAKQAINNACSSQSVINVLLNCNHPDISLGPELTKLKELSMSFDPKTRGVTMSNSHVLRNSHNSLSEPTLYEFGNTSTTSKVEDIYQYTSFIPINGRLYELNGLFDGPIDHGPIAPEQDWLDVVRPVIITRITKHVNCDFPYSVMAIVSDKKMLYERQIQELTNDTQALRLNSDDVESKVKELRMLSESEDRFQEMHQEELTLRRTTHLPFLSIFMQIFKEEEKPVPLYVNAKRRALKKKARKLKAKQLLSPRITSPPSPSNPSCVLPASEQPGYTLADLNSIFTEPQEVAGSLIYQQDTFQQKLSEPVPNMDVFESDNFLKDFVLDPGLDMDLDNIFDHEPPSVDAVLKPEDFTINNPVCDPEPGAQPDHKSE